MTTDAEIRTSLEGLAAAFNAHDIERVMSFFSSDCSLDMPRGKEPHGTRFEGKEQVRKGLRGRFESTPDVHYSELEHFVSGDCGMSRWLLTGTKLDGEKVRVRGCDFYTFRDGQICRKDSYWKIVEQQHALAHMVGNAVEQAYRRSSALDKRRKLMEAWADYCGPTINGPPVFQENELGSWEFGRAFQASPEVPSSQSSAKACARIIRKGSSKLKRPTAKKIPGLRKHAKNLGYPQELINPILPKDLRIVGGRAGTIYDQADREKNEFNRRFARLLVHYGLQSFDKKDAQKLALLLAEDWVPGLAIADHHSRRPGAPKKTSKDDLLALVESIDNILKSDSKRSVQEACRRFREHPDTSSRWKSVSVGTIRNRYHDGKKLQSAENSTFESKVMSSSEWQQVIRSLAQLFSKKR